MNKKTENANDLNSGKNPVPNHSLAHTKWNCKYHIVFAPKFRRMMFFVENKEEIGAILRELCS